MFFEGATELSRARSWRVAMIIHPDEGEFYANVARGAASFVDLDPRRAEALAICREYGLICADISRDIYQRALQQQKNPYFSNNHHYSSAGTRISIFARCRRRRASATSTSGARPSHGS